MAEVHEIGDGIFRIGHYNEQFKIGMSQFLILDEEPMLFHTGFRHSFQDTLAGVRTIVDPAKLRYISWSHWEGDEAGDGVAGGLGDDLPEHAPAPLRAVPPAQVVRPRSRPRGESTRPYR